MGIHGLWGLIEPTSVCITLDALEGKRLAIDFSLWIYQARSGFSNCDSHQFKNQHLLLLINRVSKLLHYKIRPIFVFDGDEIPRFKQHVLRNRSLKQYVDEINNKRQKSSNGELMSLNHLANQSSNSTYIDNASTTGVLEELLLTSKPSTSADYESKGEIFVESTHSYQTISETKEANESFDQKIAFIEEMRERKKNSRLRPAEIPDDAIQFSKFQLDRLIERNKLNIELEKLKENRIWQNIQKPINDGQQKFIVTGKQRVHFINMEDDIQDVIIEDQGLIEVDCEIKNRHLLLEENCEEDSNLSDDDFVDISDEGNYVDDICSELIWPSDFDVIEEKFERSISENEDFDSNELVVEGKEEDVDTYQNRQIFFKTNKDDSAIRHKDIEGIYTDCQSLLTLLGMPFLQAPGEAEAQCAELERLGLVDGVVTDDSDVWLFGAKRVYRHMFSRKAHLQRYTAEDIEQKMGLKRGDFIQLGMLVGGDYSRGLEQVGIVSALELMAKFADQTCSIMDEFEKALSTLNCISNWITLQRQQRPSSQLHSAHGRIIESNRSNVMFPNVEVFEAYTKPKVNSSMKNFSWNRIEFASLEKFLHQKLGLTRQTLSKITYGVLEKWDAFINRSKQMYQMRMTDYVKNTDNCFDGILGTNGKSKLTTRTERAVNNIKRIISKSEMRKDRVILESDETMKKNKPQCEGICERIISKSKRKRRKALKREKSRTHQNKISKDDELKLSEESSSD